MNRECVGKPAEFLQSLDETERRHFFFVLDYVTDHIVHRGEIPPLCTLDTLTDKIHVTSYIWSFAHFHDRDTFRQKVATLQALKPLFLAVPPGQATGHRISAPGPVKRTDAPLSGAVLLDGCATAWQDRLKEKSSNYYTATGGPLILNYYEARQIRAEYASLEFKTLTPGRVSDFPNTIKEQQTLVGVLYDAIMNMDDILEKKRPISLKNSAVAEESSENTASPLSRKRTASERDEDENHNDGTGSQCSSEGSPSTADKPKDTISVSKVKSLSRIEVEMLCWEILYTVRDVDRGQLPFMSWSGRDWGWDAQFATFHERFEAVATTLRRSKAAVCSLLESDYMARLAAHPRREYRRKENNRSQNAERNAQVFVGRHAIGTGQVQVGTTGDLQDRDGNVVAAAGTVHNGLIEQTRKLGEMGRRDAAAKKAKLASGAVAKSAEIKTDGTAADSVVTKTEDAAAGPAQRKPRVRKRKPLAKVAAEEAGCQPAEAGMEKTEGSQMMQYSGVNQDRAAMAAMEGTPSDSSLMNAPFVNPITEGFAMHPATPGLWPTGSGTVTTAVPTPELSFSPLPQPWVSNYGPLFPSNGNVALPCSTTLVDYTPFTGAAAVNPAALHDGSFTMPAEFPSVTSSINLLNTGVSFGLPFYPKPAGTAPQETTGTASHLQVQQISEMPMDDVYRMAIAINGSNSTEQVNHQVVVDQQDTVNLGAIEPMLPNGESEGQDIMHQLEVQLALGMDSTAENMDNVALDNGLATSLPMDMGLGTFDFITNLWALQNDCGFTDLANDSERQ